MFSTVLVLYFLWSRTTWETSFLSCWIREPNSSLNGTSASFNFVSLLLKSLFLLLNATRCLAVKRKIQLTLWILRSGSSNSLWYWSEKKTMKLQTVNKNCRVSFFQITIYLNCSQSPISRKIVGIERFAERAVSNFPNECQIYLRDGGQFGRRREKPHPNSHSHLQKPPSPTPSVNMKPR